MKISLLFSSSSLLWSFVSVDAPVARWRCLRLGAWKLSSRVRRLVGTGPREWSIKRQGHTQKKKVGRKATSQEEEEKVADEELSSFCFSLFLALCSLSFSALTSATSYPTSHPCFAIINRRGGASKAQRQCYQTTGVRQERKSRSQRVQNATRIRQSQTHKHDAAR